MNPTDSGYRIVWQDRMGAVARDAWDRLAIAAPTPFLEWDWLELLESSGSIVPARGWTPQHLTVWHCGRLAAAAPLYIKTDSEAEFVFDQPWADLARRLQAPYYPKLVGAVPVTPLCGYRFLCDAQHDPQQLMALMVEAIAARCRLLGLGGCHLHFADPQQWHQARRYGFAAWHHHGFVWQNQGYESFEAFLERFSGGQRRNIRRERQSLARSGIRTEIFVGPQIPEAFFPLMYRCYADTNRRYGPWGGLYLTPGFFSGLAERFGHRLLFVAGGPEPAADPLGMAMLVCKGKQLYGRYWGGRCRVPGLHFEACYYRPIAWAIQNGMDTFDPGMGGAHKLRRGFVSRSTLSLHRFVDPRLTAIMAAHIGPINRQTAEGIEALNAAMPFRP